MLQTLFRCTSRGLLAIALLSPFACTSSKISNAPATIEPGSLGAAEAGPTYWWHVQIAVHWPENRDPDWSIDALLANEVFAPILSGTHSTPALWRFHRRAKRDSAGQNFSFLFYAGVSDAQRIFDECSKNDLLKTLLTKGVIDQVRLDEISSPTLPRIEDTSDRAWPGALQRAWPAFAMGASTTWLSLVQQTANTQHLNRDNLENLLQGYREVSRGVNKIWHDNGQHAFVHHLSAMFGYAPLELKTEIQF